MQIFSYYKGSVIQACSIEGIVETTNADITYEVASYDISEYQGKVMNIQVVATRGGATKVYINGKIKTIQDGYIYENGEVKEKTGVTKNTRTSINSGKNEVKSTQVIIGDLRPLRNLKYEGIIYDFEVYPYALSEDEVAWNYQYSKDTWIDKINNR